MLARASEPRLMSLRAERARYLKGAVSPTLSRVGAEASVTWTPRERVASAPPG